MPTISYKAAGRLRTGDQISASDGRVLKIAQVAKAGRAVMMTFQNGHLGEYAALEVSRTVEVVKS